MSKQTAIKELAIYDSSDKYIYDQQESLANIMTSINSF